jgi:hypothetical protein
VRSFPALARRTKALHFTVSSGAAVAEWNYP